MRRGVLAALATAAALVNLGSTTAGARGRPPLRACGQVVTRLPKTGNLKVFAISQVSARRLSCARARGFVRAWERLGDTGKLPDAAGGKVKKGVLVYARWGRAYRVRGFVCRSMAIRAPGPVVPEIVNCGAHAGLVTWHESGRFG